MTGAENRAEYWESVAVPSKPNVVEVNEEVAAVGNYNPMYMEQVGANAEPAIFNLDDAINVSRLERIAKVKVAADQARVAAEQEAARIAADKAEADRRRIEAEREATRFAEEQARIAAE